MWVGGSPCPEQFRPPLLGFLIPKPTKPFQTPSPGQRLASQPSPGPVSLLQGNPEHTEGLSSQQQP